MNFTSVLIIFKTVGNFLENDFWTAPSPPPPINNVHGSLMENIDIIGDAAEAPGPLACPSRSARPRNIYLTKPNPKIIKINNNFVEKSALLQN